MHWGPLVVERGVTRWRSREAWLLLFCVSARRQDARGMVLKIEQDWEYAYD